jgi:hypothetical protein
MNAITSEPPTFNKPEYAPRRARPATSAGVYPDPNTDLGKAWAAAWRELAAAGTEYLDGVELAARSAKVSNLKDSTMVTLFTRAATAGILERTHRPATTTRGIRRRTFYRVPQGQ